MSLGNFFDKEDLLRRLIREEIAFAAVDKPRILLCRIIERDGVNLKARIMNEEEQDAITCTLLQSANDNVSVKVGDVGLCIQPTYSPTLYTQTNLKRIRGTPNSNQGEAFFLPAINQVGWAETLMSDEETTLRDDATVKLRVGDNTVVVDDSSVTITVGSHEVVVDGSGVSVKGTTVTIEDVTGSNKVEVTASKVVVQSLVVELGDSSLPNPPNPILAPVAREGDAVTITSPTTGIIAVGGSSKTVKSW